jgi:hypothetical protein
VVAWGSGRALEDELFQSLTHAGISALIDHAIEMHGEDLIDEHIRSASENTRNLQDIQADAIFDLLSVEDRALLGKAARTRKAGWFKSITWMEEVAREIVGPNLADAEAGFCEIIKSIFVWAGGAGA